MPDFPFNCNVWATEANGLKSHLVRHKVVFALNRPAARVWIIARALQQSPGYTESQLQASVDLLVPFEIPP